tara:strand:- start:177 stop:389 length:213 start_codon:yes stop_codon:yes gene_type:complete
MWIRWKNKVHLEIVTNYHADGFTDTEQEHFNANETMEVDIIEDREDGADIQFGDGSVAFNVDKAWFEVLE